MKAVDLISRYFLADTRKSLEKLMRYHVLYLMNWVCIELIPGSNWFTTVLINHPSTDVLFLIVYSFTISVRVDVGLKSCVMSVAL